MSFSLKAWVAPAAPAEGFGCILFITMYPGRCLVSIRGMNEPWTQILQLILLLALRWPRLAIYREDCLCPVDWTWDRQPSRALWD